MLIWAILFLVVLGVSFVLAFRSMGDYREVPLSSMPSSVFLVGNPQAFSPDILQKMHEAAFQGKFILSFERLFRGSKRALVVFGPVDIIQPFSLQLQLTEIEDYSLKATDKMRAWEVGRKFQQTSMEPLDILNYTPGFHEDEEFWWQVILRPEVDSIFATTIRAVFGGSDNERAMKLQEKLSKIGKSQGFSILPQAYKNEQVIKFYRDRSVHLGSVSNPRENLKLSIREVCSLLGLEDLATCRSKS